MTGRRPLSFARAADDAISREVHARRTRLLDRVAYGLSSAADHSLLWIAAGALRAARRGEPAIVLRMAAAMGIESALTNGPIKAGFGRLRPPDRGAPHASGPLPYGLRRPITSSFPSGHASAAFTAATLLSAGSRARPAWFALGAAVAASRVYVGLHHPSDVAAGAALGLIVGRCLARIIPLEPECAPGL